jgi:hypothetical protein
MLVRASRCRLVVGAMILLATAAGAVAREARSDEREILRVEAILCAAFEKGDADTLRNHLDSRFTLTSSRGEVSDLAQNLDEVARRDPFYDVFRNHEQKIRLYRDAAIVTGITTVKGHSAGQSFDGDFQYTDTWVRENGRWKLAASHASRLPK